MTAAAARNDAPSLRRLARAGRLLGMPLLFAAAMAATVAIHPDFGSFEIQSLALGALPLALAAAAQAIVIISGGIDLSIGSMIAVSNVLSASLMQHATFGQSLALSLLVLAAGAAQGLLNGLVVAVSRIPDVVATLTTGFIWGGVALLILERPGGGAPAAYLNIAAGADFGPWAPNALVVMVVAVVAIWLPIRLSRIGLLIYAAGSDPVAAFRSGVNVMRARTIAYMFSGIACAVGGMALTMTTGIGAPLAGAYYTLSSVAAVVIGGVSLAGGRGGNGRAGHRRASADARADGSRLPRHRPELRAGHPGHADRAGGDGRRPLRLSARTQMSAVLTFLRARTIYALILLLVLFVVGVELVRPGTVTPLWASNTILFAAPLAIIGGGQTMVMLTGGIDLSVASVATGAAYLLATNASLGALPAIGLALLLGAVVGIVNGIGVALLRVQPLVMTLGAGLMTGGVMIVYSQHMMASQPHVPEIIQTLGAGKVLGLVPVDLFLWLVIGALILFGLQRTGFGRLLYAVGDNREACHLAGVRVWRVLFANYLICAILAAITGLVLVGGTNAADLSLADSYLLPSVACVVIGGTSIFGGRGGYSGTIVGALILTVLTGLLTLLDVSEPIKQILYGAIILSLAAAYARLTE